MIVSEIKEIDYVSCTLEQPLQLMWLNQFGGVDTWVFSRHQEYSADVSDVDEFEQVVNYLQLTNARQKTLRKDVYTVINLGYEQLNAQQVAGISQLLASPLVYVISGGNYAQVGVKAGTYKIYDTGESMHKLEFDIILPKRFTQSL